MIWVLFSLEILCGCFFNRFLCDGGGYFEVIYIRKEEESVSERLKIVN